LRAGLLGEAGPEAIMPLRRAQNGQLGVVAQGQSGPVYNINVAGDATPATARMIESALAKYDRQRRRMG
jgi:lambda family phage tail tape measure protein